jgi:hypothetical protein
MTVLSIQAARVRDMEQKWLRLAEAALETMEATNYARHEKLCAHLGDLGVLAMHLHCMPEARSLEELSSAVQWIEERSAAVLSILSEISAERAESARQQS